MTYVYKLPTKVDHEVKRFETLLFISSLGGKGLKHYCLYPHQEEDEKEYELVGSEKNNNTTLLNDWF